MFGRTGQFIDGNKIGKVIAFTVCIDRNPIKMKRLIKRENFRQKQKAYEILPFSSLLLEQQQMFLSVNMPVPIKDNLKIFTEISVQGKAIPSKIVP